VELDILLSRGFQRPKLIGAATLVRIGSRKVGIADSIIRGHTESTIVMGIVLELELIAAGAQPGPCHAQMTSH
jgi:hypothetical protein